MKTNLILAAVLMVCLWAFLKAEPKSALIGQPAPELHVTYFKEGAAPDLKGKPTLVEFWATWCPPCRKSIPHLNEIHQKYGGKGLQIVGITEEDKATVAAFIKDMPMDYHVALDETGKDSEAFGISGIPHAFLVGKDGKIVWEGHPMALEEKDIESLVD